MSEYFEENNQELLGLTITSNCNNEIGYIPTPPACEECVKLTCKPLGSIGIDLTKINEIQKPELIGTGGMNRVYDISYECEPDKFSTAGEDGTIRLFDLRDLNHSTIIYES